MKNENTRMILLSGIIGIISSILLSISDSLFLGHPMSGVETLKSSKKTGIFMQYGH